MTTPVTYPWAGGTNFVDCKSIPITGATPTEQSGTATNQAATYDCRIAEAAPDTVANDFLVVQSYSVGDQRSLLEFDVTTVLLGIPVGAVVTWALTLVGYGPGLGDAATGRTYWAYQLTDAGWDETSTWNHRTGTTHWDGAAGNIDTVPSWVTVNPSGSSAVVPAGGVGTMTWDVTDIVEDAIANESNVARFIIKDETEGSATRYQNQFRDRAYATATSRPKLVATWAYTPTVPNPYTVLIDLHKGNPSVEEDAVGWNINSRGAFNNRYPISVKTYSAMSIGDTFEVLVDTQTMVAAVDAAAARKFFPDGAVDQTWATKVEFVFQDGDDKTTLDSYYWTYCALGVPDGFNKPGTRYYIACPHALAANTNYTFWMYFDKERCADDPSSNYSGANAGTKYQDFSAAAANLAAFLAAYTDWEQDTTNAPTVVVASDVLTLTGNADATWRGIATKATIGSNFHAIFRITAAPGAGFACGIIDAAGIIAGANQDGAFLYAVGTDEFWTYLDGVSSGPGGGGWNCDYPTAPFSIDICKYGAKYRYIMERNDPDNQPETYCKVAGEAMRGITATDVAHKLFIASKAATGGSVDSIFCYTEQEFPPEVKAPAVTYLKPGVIFGGDKHLNFPYDSVLALSDATILYIGDDRLVQLTSEPGATAQLAVRVPLDLSANQTIYYYAGHASITQAAPHDHWTNASAWDEYDDFAAVADWTAETGTWAVDDYMNPVLSKSPTGNIGASPGRCWSRFPNVFSWNGHFYGVFSSSLFETGALFWPAPNNAMIAEAPGVGQEFGTPVLILKDQADQGIYPGPWPGSVYVDGTDAIYVAMDATISGGEYCTKVWKCTATNPMDPDNWTMITGNILSDSWIDAHGGPTTTYITHKLYKRGSDWYFIIGGTGAGDTGAVYETHTTDDPTTWDDDTFSNVVEIFDNVAYCEDFDIQYDSVTDHTYLYFYSATGPGLYYSVLHEHLGGGNVFPGAGAWAAEAALTFDKASWATGWNVSPRIYNNIAVDTYLYLYCSGQPEVDTTNTYFAKWSPCWIQVCRSAGDFTHFDEYNLDSKYKQTDTAAFYRSYKTGTSYTDISMVAEVQAGARAVGLCYRMSDAGNTGYFAAIDYVSAGASIVQLYSYSGNTLTTIGTAYSIPAWPEPGALGYFHLNTPWRLRVDVVGSSHKVYYSRWGGPWQAAKSETNSSLMLAGPAGAGFNLSGGAINEWKVRKIVSPEPTVGQYANVGGAGMMLCGNF